jgi:hypothetical protein
LDSEGRYPDSQFNSTLGPAAARLFAGRGTIWHQWQTMAKSGS